jgi:glycyl-tRNA synthetase alpha subunit
VCNTRAVDAEISLIVELMGPGFIRSRDDLIKIDMTEVSRATVVLTAKRPRPWTPEDPIRADLHDHPNRLSDFFEFLDTVQPGPVNIEVIFLGESEHMRL